MRHKCHSRLLPDPKFLRYQMSKYSTLKPETTSNLNDYWHRHMQSKGDFLSEGQDPPARGHSEIPCRRERGRMYMVRRMYIHISLLLYDLFEWCKGRLSSGDGGGEKTGRVSCLTCHFGGCRRSKCRAFDSLLVFTLGEQHGSCQFPSWQVLNDLAKCHCVRVI